MCRNTPAATWHPRDQAVGEQPGLSNHLGEGAARAAKPWSASPLRRLPAWAYLYAAERPNIKDELWPPQPKKVQWGSYFRLLCKEGQTYITPSTKENKLWNLKEMEWISYLHVQFKCGNSGRILYTEVKKNIWKSSQILCVFTGMRYPGLTIRSIFHLQASWCRKFIILRVNSACVWSYITISECCQLSRIHSANLYSDAEASKKPL